MSSIFYPMHRMIKAVLPKMLAPEKNVAKSWSDEQAFNAIKGRAGGATLYSGGRGAALRTCGTSRTRWTPYQRERTRADLRG